MDESALERMLREAPLPAFRDGHEGRLEARYTLRCDACSDSQRDDRPDAASAARFGPHPMRVDRQRGRARWITSAAGVVFASLAAVLVTRSNGGESAPARVTTVPVYWSRPVGAVRLDVRRWSCEGCTQGSGAGSPTRHRPRRRKGWNQ